MERMRQDLEAIRNATPVYDATEETAMYALQSAANGGASRKVIFNKVDGLWLLNRDPQ